MDDRIQKAEIVNIGDSVLKNALACYSLWKRGTIFIFLLIFMPGIFLYASDQDPSPAIPSGLLDYTLRMEKPNSHYFDIAVTVNNVEAEYVDFVMPSWSPGRYIIYDFAKYVINAKASDQHGKEKKVIRIDKNTWRVFPASKELVFYYSVYANYLSGTFSQLSENGAVINGASIFMFMKDRDAEPLTVSVLLPPNRGWSIVSSLPSGAGANVYRARDYRHLIDSPMTAGIFSRYMFESGATPFHVIFHESSNNKHHLEIVRKLKTICDAEYGLFGEYPFGSYCFFYDFGFGPGEWDAMEHRCSMRMTSPVNYDSDQKVSELLRISAHELFHAWNIKSMVPLELVRPDLTKEVYCPSLWIAEGLTSYYQYLILLRSGIITRYDFRQIFRDMIALYEANPGKKYMTLKEASILPWLERYGVEDSERYHTTVSYYRKGAIVGLLLDLKIRGVTGGARGLDNVFGEFRKKYGSSNKGYTEMDFRDCAAEVAGYPLDDFFNDYVDDKKSLPYSSLSSECGLRIEQRNGLFLPFLGAETEGNRIIWIVPYSPAESAGLQTGDVLYAIGSIPVVRDLHYTLFEFHPNQKTSISIFRDGNSLRLPVTLGSRVVSHFVFDEVGTVNDATKEIREAFYSGK